MLRRLDPIHLERTLRAAAPEPRFPPIDRRDAWQALRTDLGENDAATLIANAEDAVAAPIPPLPATLFLQVDRTGEREGYEQAQSRRREMLLDLAIGECLEDQGRFLDAILDVAWAICEESSWVFPAHQVKLTDIHRPYLDLGVAMTALELAEMDALLGARLEPLLRKRIYDELDRRAFTPYLTRHDHWWLYQDPGRAANWNAVCNAGIVGAALYVEQDPARLAEILARGAHSLASYVDSFDRDGGSSEGPGYWDYGFGYYTILADLVDWRTGGAVDLLAGERMAAIAAYPLRTLLSGDTFATFSDCDVSVQLSRPVLTYLAQRLENPALAGLAARQSPFVRRSNFSHGVRELFWRLPEGDDAALVPAAHDWFADMMWMIARLDPADSNALVLAAKGGNNLEMHNQNDVGSIIVHVDGESLVTDLGSGRYTKAYFHNETRYEFFVNSSIGHSVPVPNGQAQAHGAEHTAYLLQHHADEKSDRLQIEMAAAYPAAADLVSLQRSVVLHRDGPHGWIELIDEAAFADGPGAFETVLITLGAVELGDGGLVIHGLRGALRITFDAAEVEARVDVHPEVELHHGVIDVRRLVFSWPETRPSGRIRLELVPLPRDHA